METITCAYTPQTLAEALEIRKNLPVIPFAGGTDLMARRRSWAGTLSRFESPVLFIGDIKKLQEISRDNTMLRIGAAVTLAGVYADPDVPDILKQAVAQMASPAIRNAGTLGGNICNASPAADTLPPLYALGASVVLQSVEGRRVMPVEDFIQGPGKTALRSEELLVEIDVPLEPINVTYYKKVGTRKADALSKVSFAGLAEVSNGVVTDIRIALGAVAPRVARDREAENLLKGAKVAELQDLISVVEKRYAALIQPIDDQRSNAAYRTMASFRLMEYFITVLIR